MEDANQARRREVALAGHTDDPARARAGLSDADAKVRGAALRSLDRLGDLHDDELAAATADADAGVRRTAANMAAGHPAVALLGLLHDDDTTVVEMAAYALGEQGAATSEVVSALVTVVSEHDDALCRESAVAALGALGHVDGLPAILAATKDKPAVRRRAVIALAPFDGPEVDAALHAALEDRDWQVRQAAEDQLR